MAKLKGPLLSLGASGAIGKTMVHFNWKGLNVVREYVVPTNPQSDAQVSQRDKLTAAVAGIHKSMADATYPLVDEDKSAFSLLGSLEPTPRTWFNTIAKLVIDQLVDGVYWCIFSAGHCTPGTDKLTVTAHITAAVGAEPTTGKLYYGLAKSALLSSIVCTVADLATGKDITALVTGTKYYVQYRPSTVGYVNSDSGIYTGVPT